MPIPKRITRKTIGILGTKARKPIKDGFITVSNVQFSSINSNMCDGI